MDTQFAWYDSLWLRAYCAGKAIVAEVAPARLEEFVHAFDPLRTSPDFEPRHLRRQFAPEMLESIRETVRSIPRDKLEFHELQAFGRIVVHNWPAFTRLQASLTDQVSEWAGEALEPQYNFLSLYLKMGKCDPHLDTPSAKWTLDICIDQTEPWPVQFSQIIPWPEERLPLSENWRDEIRSDPDLQFRSVAMEPGDAILFSGSSQWHYRDGLPHDDRKHHCDLLFLHYIPAGTRELVEARNWPDLFGIPELDTIPGIENVQ